jgi:hypothetical protein
VNLFPGDSTILMALYEYRVLTSGQLGRITRRNPQVIRRAIRKRLRPGEFVSDLRRNSTEEAAYMLGPEGVAFVAHELGCEPQELGRPNKTNTVRTFHFRHWLLVTDVRIAFSLATAGATNPVCIERIIGEWETVPHAAPTAAHHERFILSERLVGNDGVARFHRPDCLFLMYSRDDGRGKLVAVFLEADRNTEAMPRIREKYEAFWLYWARKRFVEAFGAVAMRVVFVLDDVTDRTRIRSMQKLLRDMVGSRGKPGEGDAFRKCFRFARKQDLDESSVMTKPIWFDADDNARVFFQPVRPVREVSARAEVSA